MSDPILPPPVVSNFVDKDIEKLQELCELEEGLTNWEVDFVDDVMGAVKAGRQLTQGQRTKIRQIHEDRC